MSSSLKSEGNPPEIRLVGTADEILSCLPENLAGVTCLYVYIVVIPPDRGVYDLHHLNRRHNVYIDSSTRPGLPWIRQYIARNRLYGRLTELVDELFTATDLYEVKLTTVTLLDGYISAHAISITITPNMTKLLYLLTRHATGLCLTLMERVWRILFQNGRIPLGSTHSLCIVCSPKSQHHEAHDVEKHELFCTLALSVPQKETIFANQMQHRADEPKIHGQHIESYRLCNVSIYFTAARITPFENARFAPLFPDIVLPVMDNVDLIRAYTEQKIQDPVRQWSPFTDRVFRAVPLCPDLARKCRRNRELRSQLLEVQVLLLCTQRFPAHNPTCPLGACPRNIVVLLVRHYLAPQDWHTPYTDQEEHGVISSRIIKFAVNKGLAKYQQILIRNEIIISRIKKQEFKIKQLSKQLNERRGDERKKDVTDYDKDEDIVFLTSKINKCHTKIKQFKKAQRPIIYEAGKAARNATRLVRKANDYLDKCVLEQEVRAHTSATESINATSPLIKKRKTNRRVKMPL